MLNTAKGDTRYFGIMKFAFVLLTVASLVLAPCVSADDSELGTLVVDPEDPDFVEDIVFDPDDPDYVSVEDVMLETIDDETVIEEEIEIDEEAAKMDEFMEEIANTLSEEDEDDYGGRRHLLEKGPNGCTVVKTMRDIASLNGKTTTLCSFEINSKNKGCNSGTRGYSVTKKTSLTCEEGGTCHINCPTGHFYVTNKSELSLIGNFVLEGSQQSAINFHSGTLNMVGATIKNNSHKPAIFLFYRAIAIICDCTFEGNGAGITSNGGAIALHRHHARLQISGSVFRNNRAKGKGGAIYALGQPSHDQAAFTEITGSIFEGNQARYGDHVYSEPHPNHANGFKTDACQEGGTTFSGSRTCNGIARGHTGQYCMAGEDACMVPRGADAYVLGLDLWKLRPEGVCASNYKDLPPPPCVPIDKMSDLTKLTSLARDLSVTLCSYHLSKQKGGCDGEYRINSGTARWYHKPRKTSLTCESGGKCITDCVQQHHIAGGCHNFGCTFALSGNFVFSRAYDCSAMLGSGTHTFTGVKFEKNSGRHYSGAINMGQGHLNLCNCTFEDNKGYGGALRAVHGLANTWMISGSTFRRNSSPKGSGGAIIAGCRDRNRACMFAIKDSIFEDNWARDKGDHIMSYGDRDGYNGFKTDLCEKDGTTFSGSKKCNGIERGNDGCVATSHCNVPYDYVGSSKRKQTPVSHFPNFLKFDASFSNGECPAPPTPAPTPSPTASPTTRSPTPAPTPDEPTPEDKKTNNAYSKGDPHFKTFGGEMYDFHGECDLVLLHNPDFKDRHGHPLGMDIHIRTKIESFWSSIESAVIRLGDETMEIRADPKSKEWLWFGGHEVTTDLIDGEWNHHQLAGFLVRFKSSAGSRGRGSTREANIYLKGSKANEVLVMKTFKGFVRIDIDWKGSDHYYNSVGLLGSHAHEGKRLSRDGKFIEDVNAFGQEWQVIPEVDGSLFHDYEGAVVGKKCIMPPAYHEGDKLDVSSLRRRRLGASALDQAAAEKACNHLVDPKEKQACVYDVIATQDLSMASTW